MNESNNEVTVCDGCKKLAPCTPFKDQYGVVYVELCHSCMDDINNDSNAHDGGSDAYNGDSDDEFPF